MAEIGKELAEKEQNERAGQTQGGQTQPAPSGAHATQAAVPGAPTAADVKPLPPARGATEAQAPPPGAHSQAAQTQASASQPEGVASFITIEDFARVEMR